MTRCGKVYKNRYYMETITKDRFIKIFQDKSISLFTLDDILKIFEIRSNTAKSLLARLKKRNVIGSLTKGKYQFLMARKIPEDFLVANFLYSPSYVSLESALSYYGLIDQFPYQITSVTFKKNKTIETENKKFVYNHVKGAFFVDYKKTQEEYLIASPQKAVFDLIYLVYKGGRAKSILDLLNLDRGELKKENLKDYFNNLAKNDSKFLSFCKNQKLI